MHNLPSSASRAAALALLTACRCDELPPIRGMRDVKPSDTSASEFEVCSHRTGHSDQLCASAAASAAARITKRARLLSS